MAKHKFLLVAVALVVFASASYALLSKTVTIKSVGNIVTLGVEVDVDAIDWGNVYPNETTTKLIHVRPTGNTPATLSVNTSNWNPANASTYLTLTWNYTGATLQPNDWITVELALYVSPLTEGITNFSFDILIATEET